MTPTVAPRGQKMKCFPGRFPPCCKRNRHPELHRRSGRILHRGILPVPDGGLGIQHLGHPAGRGKRPRKRNHQIGHYDQGNEDLIDIIDKRDDLPCGHPARFDPHPAKPDDEQYGEVHDELSQRIEDGGELPHPDRRIGMGSGRLAEAGLFFSCAGKGADDPHPRQNFPAGSVSACPGVLALSDGAARFCA